MNGSQKLCFVAMGYGKKTDYESGRTLDMDATYDAIIRPAVTEQGLRCVRAKDLKHSGVIDVEMYEMLLRADLVVADISTSNVNAVYELGVRHALRPKATIIMKEKAGRVYFDLNHISTLDYEHLGEDIGVREAARAKQALGALIAEVMAAQKPDSPVYVFLPQLKEPRLSDVEFEELVDKAAAVDDRLAELLRTGVAASKASQHEDAARAFAAADKMKRDDPYIIQQLALNRYKTRQPSALDALMEGLRIIERLAPDDSNDPETLGITGAIRKRLWLLTRERAQLDAAIRYYARGFEVRRDYYNGDNLATCYDFRAAVQGDPTEAQYDRMTAQKIRQTLIEVLKEQVQMPAFSERFDRHWVFATLATCSFALNRATEAQDYENRFLAEKPAKWEIETYNDGKKAVADRLK